MLDHVRQIKSEVVQNKFAQQQIDQEQLQTKTETGGFKPEHDAVIVIEEEVGEMEGAAKLTDTLKIEKNDND